MTILTKVTIHEKKSDCGIAPLVENDANSARDPEDPNNPRIVIGVRRVSSITVFFLFLVSLAVVCLGIYSGKYFYNQYLSTQVRHFRREASIPLYNDQFRPESLMQVDSNESDLKEFDKFVKDFFSEDLNFYTGAENAEKIDVPDFVDGRRGRFIHDFNTNMTGIIDMSARRCFIMPLNRENVLPPKSLFDLVQKMWGGYYKVDTQVVRETMRVVTPPLDDLKDVGTFISQECEGRPVYKLEKFVGGVVKRSTTEGAKFAQFAGKKITQFDIINMDAVLEYEKTLK